MMMIILYVHCGRIVFFIFVLFFCKATIESRLTSSDSPPESLSVSSSDEEFYQKVFQSYCLIEIHLHHMVSNLTSII